jgi:3',5'-cyclic AMP phosphodiesterase CpdA
VICLAQLSDPHITARGHLLDGTVDTAAMLARAVRAVAELRPAPAAVLITGDLVERGQPAEYDHLRELLEPLAMPVYLMPGNHDDTVALCRSFETHHYLQDGLAAASDGRLRYEVQVGPLRLLALDSRVPGIGAGCLSAAQLDWLDTALCARPDTPTLVAVHHPPFDTGIRFMDAMGLIEGREGLAQVLRRHSQVERVLCGHVHRAITSRFGGTLAMTAPSTAHQILLDLREDGLAGCTMEPPGMLLHAWQAGQLVSHTVSLPEQPATVRYFGAG